MATSKGMNDPRERRLAKLADVEARAKEREALIAELGVEHREEHGYQAKLAKMSGLTRGRIHQIISRALADG